VPAQPPQGGSRHASRAEQDQQLRQAQSRLHEALAHAHKQQLLKAEAQLRARHAEQWLAEYSQGRVSQPPAPRFRLPRNASAVLVFCITAFIVGSYLSLLVPMRKRFLMQEATLHQLDEAQQYLTRQNEALMQQLAGQPSVEAL
jgi:hypothetical protein